MNVPCNMAQNDTRIYRYSRGQIAMSTEQLLKAVCDFKVDLSETAMYYQ